MSSPGSDVVGGDAPSEHAAAGAAVATGVEYSVGVGESFSHDADYRYHQLQYQFKPNSILNDEGHDGQLLLSGDRNAEQARVEFHHRKGGARRVVCRGRRRPSKDNEVLLIFDPRAQRFVLERVSGFVSGLRHERDPDDSAMADEEHSRVGKAAAAVGRSDSDSDDSLSDLDSDSDSADDTSAVARAGASTKPGASIGSDSGRMQEYVGAGRVVAKKPRVEQQAKAAAKAAGSASTAADGDSSDLSDSD